MDYRYTEVPRVIEPSQLQTLSPQNDSKVAGPSIYVDASIVDSDIESLRVDVG
jgi:hypothetical protein